MRALFAVMLIALLVATAVMMRLPGGTPNDGKLHLSWTSDDNPLRRPQMALFTQMNPGIEVGLDPANQNVEKVIVQSLGGVGPDLFDCRDANQLAAFVKAGIALDVTDELAKMGIDLKRDTWPATHQTSIYEGRAYGVPTNVGSNALWVNKDLVEKAGITLPKGPWTWEQFIPIAQKLTIRGPGGRVVQAGFLFDWWNWEHFVIGYGARVYSPDGTCCVLDSPKAIAAIQMMQDLVHKYHVSPSPAEEAGMAGAGGWGAGNMNLFGAKRGVFALGGRWWLANLRNFEGLKLGVVESPTGGVRHFGSATRVTLVNKQSPYVREALKFLAYEGSREYNDLINDQADGICGFIKYAQGDRYLHNPQYPQEDYNDIWRLATEYAVASDSSPFVNGQVANRLISEQLDLVRINDKTAAQAMRDAAKAINAKIQETIAEDPELKARYAAAVARGSR